MEIQELLQQTIDKSASDLHIVPFYHPTLRINGELYFMEDSPQLDPKDTQRMILSILQQKQKDNFATNKEIDFGYDYTTYRFRVNAYIVKGEFAASFRLITAKISPLESLNLPTSFYQFANLNQGFVLVTGPTGQGKSTTIAAIINEINNKYSKHILTIEDPIEYIYPKAKSIVSQREIGRDTLAWSMALKSSLREDPDVVLIGEMRDYETIQAALTIAETGHLVFSTLHTNSAPQTIDRIVDVFPARQQNQVRLQLSSVLKAIISQKLIPSVNNSKLIPACEVLMHNNAVASIIREGKTHLIDNVIETGSSDGMILFERYLYMLYKNGKITRDTAYKYAIRPQQISKLIG